MLRAPGDGYVLTTAAGVSPVTSPGPNRSYTSVRVAESEGWSTSLAVSWSAPESRPAVNAPEETAAAPGGCHQPKKVSAVIRPPPSRAGRRRAGGRHVGGGPPDVPPPPSRRRRRRGPLPAPPRTR